MIIKNTIPDFSQSTKAVFANWAHGGYTPTEYEKRVAAIFWDAMVEVGNAPHIHHFCVGRRFSSALGCTVNWVSHNHSTGSGTWNIATGHQTNGTSTFWNTNFIESSMAVNQDGSSTLNNIGYAVECVSNDHGTAAGDIMGAIGSVSAKQSRYTQSVGGVNRTWKVHIASTVTSALGPFASNKWVVLQRTLVNRQQVLDNFDNPTTSVTSSGDIPDRTMYVGAINNNGTAQSFMAGKFGAYIAFNANQFDTASFFVHYENMMQALGDTKGDFYPYDTVPKYSTRNDAYVLKFNGQSNCSGRSTDRLAKYTIPLDALVLWRDSKPPTLAATMYVQQLQFGVNHTYDDIAESGYELQMCYALSKRIQAKVILNKFSRAGTDLKGITVPGTWKVSSADLANISENVISVPGLQIADNTYNIKKMFMIWDQHEADVNGTDTATYNTELSLFFKYMIDQHEAAGYSFTATELHIIIRKAWTGLAGSTLADIIAAQNGAEAHFNSTHPTYASKVRSWKLFTSENLLFPDGTHMSAFSYACTGIRLGIYLSRQ